MHPKHVVTIKADKMAVLKEFLGHRYENISDVTLMEGGWFSDAYSFNAGDDSFVIRINPYKADFEKDLFAAMHFNGPGLPVPAVNGIGDFPGGKYYCITDFKKGMTIHRIRKMYGAEGERQVVPAMLNTLEKIHGLRTDTYPGWGHTTGEGAGRFASWTDFLSAPFEDKAPLNAMPDRSSVQPYHHLIKKLRAKMISLFPRLPEKKCVLHGDLRGGNLLMNDGKVTAVLDWAEMAFGDPLYDLVTMENPWEEPPVPYVAMWKSAAEQAGRAEPFFEERVLCYRCYRIIFEIEAHAIVNKPDIADKIAGWAAGNLPC